ncbi:glycosyltransferase [Vibrio sp. VB16]|uniref:glycosyltransferase n=1 Tax=Vibrio sp. VB16 TaxID=2785746 RepID=UPI0018A102FD|nr:glycosyltransferase [Vibrio sp. VB16]UGA57358.1 glycosyltransferase [Vibrio sp. VB16]
MKISLISRSDCEGGAAKAAYRLHNALNNSGAQSELLVVNRSLQDSSIKSISRFARLSNSIGLACSNLISKKFSVNKFGLKSLNLIGSRVLGLIADDCDIVNIHWINQETLSIKQISRIRKPVVITLHDMWLFCGSEHYTESDYYIEGIESEIIYLDRLLIAYKKEQLSQNIVIVTPSKWLTDCAMRSKVLSKHRIYTIPNTLNTDIFKKNDQIESRRILNLPQKEIIIGFGAVGGIFDKRKGFYELISALKGIRKDIKFKCVVFGQSEPVIVKELECEFISFGTVKDDYTLSLLYNAFDVMVVPSRLEAFGQTASESICCGTPVVAFLYSGLIDIVENKVTGYLAEPYNSADLCRGIEWCLNDSDQELLLKASKEKSKTWSEDIVASKYKEIFRKEIANE